MLSANLIQRHFEAGRLDALADAVAANGLELPLALRIRLSQVPAAAVALALRRVIELTYGPTSLSRDLTRFIVESQDADGSFGRDPLATAAAAGALGMLLIEHPAASEPAVVAAHERALAALVSMQGDEGLFHADAIGADRTKQERAMTSAFVLYLVARDEEFRRTSRLADALNWFEQNRDELDSDTQRLWAMAGASHAGRRNPVSPAVNAIAA